MNITIVVGSRFHSLDLIRELRANGHNVELITFYPKFKIRRFGLKVDQVKSLFWIEYFIRGFKLIFGHYPNNYRTTLLFSKWASSNLPRDADIYIIWASYGLESIQTIREKNPEAKIILERGSAHILEQNRLLTSLNQKSPIDRRIIDRELKEYELADYISVPGEFAKRSFIKEGVSEKKIVVNPYGVSLKGFYPVSNKKESPHFTIGYAGILSAQKNVKGLIQACALVHGKNKKIKLKLIGPIDHHSFESNLLNKHAFVEYYSAVPQKELVNFYHTLDLFVLNSIQDGFGMVLLQAMSCGVPVVATENTGGKDVIVDGVNGRLIPINDYQRLAVVIEELLEDRVGLIRMGIEAQKTVESGFSWSAYGNRYHRFIQSL